MRKIARAIAKTNMKKKGIHKPFKKHGETSYFADHWREYVQFFKEDKMYIPEFICGIVFTILAEVIALIVYAAYLNSKK